MLQKHKKHIYHAVVIGAGPIGLEVGIALKRANLSFIIFDKGCIVNAIYNFPTAMTFFSESQKLEIGDVPFVSHGIKPTRMEALEYYRRVAMDFQLPLHLYEDVKDVQGEYHNFEVHTSKSIYKTRNVIIASGFYDQPNVLDVEGAALPKVHHYFTHPHPYAMQNVVVVGAGNSAVDVALETCRVGAHVTLVHRGPTLKSSIKYWVRPDIENRIKEKKITAYYNTHLVRITEKEVTIQMPNERKTIPNDVVFAMIGYRPNITFLQSMGLKLSNDLSQIPSYDSHTLETNRKGIYVAGVVCAGNQTGKLFIENSRIHAKYIVQHIKDKTLLME